LVTTGFAENFTSTCPSGEVPGELPLEKPLMKPEFASIWIEISSLQIKINYLKMQGCYNCVLIKTRHFELKRWDV
jgi:hypothetical protein